MAKRLIEQQQISVLTVDGVLVALKTVAPVIAEQLANRLNEIIDHIEELEHDFYDAEDFEALQPVISELCKLKSLFV